MTNSQRQEHLTPQEGTDTVEVLRADANNPDRVAIECEFLSHDFWITIESGLPKRIRKDRDRVGA
jgi:hypothetical protein